MIVNQNNQSEPILFSKYARNQAAKIQSCSPNNKNINITDTKYIKNVIQARDKIGFAKQISRDQRQKRYKIDQTPSVGQYNIPKNTKSKMIWDILKIYHGNKKHKKVCQQHKSIQQEEIQSYQKIQKSFFLKNPIPEDNIEQMQNNLCDFNNKDEKSITTSLNKSNCLINMSRITGRKPINYQTYSSNLDYNITTPMNYIKNKITKNIHMSRNDQIRSRQQKYVNPQIAYQYNYKIVKRQQKGLLDFSLSKGRKQKKKVDNQYSYQHYEYDNFSWNGCSKVYPSTKLNMIQFKKQSSRYKKIREKNSQKK